MSILRFYIEDDLNCDRNIYILLLILIYTSFTLLWRFTLACVSDLWSLSVRLTKRWIFFNRNFKIVNSEFLTVTLKLQVHRNNSLFHHHVLRKQYLPRMEVTTLRAHGIPDVTPRCIPGIPAAVCVDMCIGHRLNSSNVLRDEGLPGG